MLAGELVARGHAVRGTTRQRSGVAAIEAVGAEAFVGDPDRVATLVGALEHVTVACLLLGSARGSDQDLAALHGSRLEMLLLKLVDTTARGVVYEARGTVDPDVLRGGAQRVRNFASRSLAAVALIDSDPADPDRWLAAALDAVGRVL
jgi:hypothetical protein